MKIIAERLNKRVGEVSCIFCTDSKILEVNREFLSHDYYTDIITFDYTEGDKISGDMFISVDTVSSNAIKYKVPFEHELYRVMIHGILHLCGIEDKTPEKRIEMERYENEALPVLWEFLQTPV